MQRVGAAYYVRPSPALSTRMVSGECARLVLIYFESMPEIQGNWFDAKWARGSCQLVQPGGVDGVHESPSPCTVAGFVDASFPSYIPCPLPRSFIGTDGLTASSAFLKTPRPTWFRSNDRLAGTHRWTPLRRGVLPRLMQRGQAREQAREGASGVLGVRRNSLVPMRKVQTNPRVPDAHRGRARL